MISWLLVRSTFLAYYMTEKITPLWLAEEQANL